MKRRYALVLLTFINIIAMSNASAYEYSVTVVDDYKYSYLPYIDDLDPHGQNQYERVEYWLHDVAGWSEEFYHKDASVTESDFGTNDVGYKGLDGADFHYHSGHGFMDVGRELALHNWLPGVNYYDVRAQDVEYKWDQDNEWVLLHSCSILYDSYDWAKALNQSHGIMGFSTTSYVSTALINEFFDEAINNDETISDSYYHATKAAFGSSVRAVMISDTSAQMSYDHLNGEGTMEPDESPNDSFYAYLSWWC